MTIKEYLLYNRILTDGAMGTYYASLENNKEFISEYANLTAPEKIKNIHLKYLEAGANLLRTNTFIANTKALSITRSTLKDILHSAVAIAKDAINEYQMRKEEFGSDKSDIFIAGDIGPIREDAEYEESEVIKEYCLIADELYAAGVDAIVFETFSGTKRLLQIAEYIKSKYADLFVMAEVTVFMNGYSRDGVSATRNLETLALSKWVDAIGFNCGIGSGHMLKLLKKMRLPKNKYLMCSPNAGYPEQMQNRMVFVDNATYFANNMREIALLGVTILGACCGSTPEYIKETKLKIADIPLIKMDQLEQKSLNNQMIHFEKVSSQTNYFLNLFQRNKKVVAVELDPPHDAKDEKILAAAEVIKKCDVDIITLADSPMGRSRIDSVLMAIKLHQITGMPIMPHICCRDKNIIAMRSLLLGAYANEIRNLLLVTGDPVPQDIRLQTTGVFDYNSIQLMQFVKEMNEEHFKEEPFVYGGALNYGFANVEKIIQRMERKIEAGAEYFLTQPIYTDSDIERIDFLKQKVKTKILCGIMPLISYKNAYFIKNEVAGIHLPDEIMNRYQPMMTKEEGELVGAEIASEIIYKLKDIADGYYIMLPFNRASLMEKIVIQ